MTNQQLNAVKIVTQASAILVSILLAFAIDSWGEQANLREREREILRALHDDFSGSRIRIRQILLFHEATRELNLRLLQLAINNAELFPSEVDQMLADLSWVDSNTHVATGALSSVISGGELTLIRNAELRRILADWSMQLEAIDGVKQQGAIFFGEKWLPFFIDNGSLPQLIVLDSTMPGAETRTETGVPLKIPQPIDHSELLLDPRFQNLLATKNWVIMDYLSIYRLVEDKLNETLSLIELELAI